MKENAEIMLCAWGLWQRSHQNLGIPSISIIGRCMLEGAGASHTTVAAELSMGHAIELTEQCVLTMPKKIQRAVKHRYIGDEPDSVAAGKLKVTLREYEGRINQAVHILVNYISEY